MKTKVIVYGAGDYCKRYIASRERDRKNEEILFLIDNNLVKSNTKIMGYSVYPHVQISRVTYDKIVIAIKDYYDVLNKLLRENISKLDLWVYLGDDDKIVSVSANYKEIIEKSVFKNFALQTVKRSLMCENFFAGEFEGFQRIIVCGTEEDLYFVQEFFKNMNVGICVMKFSDSQTKWRATDKFILTCAEYDVYIQRLKKIKLISAEQCLIIPLFDVNNNIFVKK